MIDMFGYDVLRSIPTEVLLGVAKGDYQVFGGVIRWAANTAKAGQIICHLIPATSGILPLASALLPAAGTIYNGYKLYKIGGKLEIIESISQQILSNSKILMMLSGINLAVCAVGFIYINNRLSNIESKLNEIQKDVRDIKLFLESQERADLRAAISELVNLDSISELEHRKTVLHNSRQTLSRICERYKELLANSETLDKAIMSEEYYFLSSYAKIQCSAELKMFETAEKEIDDMNNYWKKQLQSVTLKYIVGNDPERFLYCEYAKDIPLEIMLELMDFANDDIKGYKWIDELRQKNRNWYPSKLLNWPVNIGTGDVANEKNKIFPAIHKIIAKNNILEGHKSQIKYFAQNKISPSEFNDKVSRLIKNNNDEFIILGPKFSK